MSAWKELDLYLHLFTSPVLSFVDEDGYPFSLRLRPRHDRDADLMRLDLPQAVTPVAGPAWLLWHRHDEDIADIAALAIQGKLTKDDDGWTFKPERVIPGPGLGPGGWGEAIQAMTDNAARYVEQRGLTQPDRIPWEGLEAIARKVLAEQNRTPFKT
ncbi:hypothetical protein JOF56_009766 [Kibdelosporangium banguiense]|uniref:Uncharacterized protein n=1 Tax=Kibdelosporangium banguiense TaxID=1365924 RepID=A0ABS4TZN7_9PSEU|nr:hypothetical protein [Kibdelosporangium banguiense]MBP2329381.1 hypothetical protein [Kibdelosporangium banguiense]